MKRIYLSPPHMSGNEQIYIQDAFEKNWIAPIGENIDAFEAQLSTYHQLPSLVVTSGTAAIHLALKVLNVQQDDLIFVSTFTFVASVNPIIYEGAQPVFIDSEKESWNMCPESLQKAFEHFKKENKLPKAVIVVHLYGQMANMLAIIDICSHYGVPIIEDAAESLGSEYNGQKSGTFGQLAAFSFNGNKIITTSGGGALLGIDGQQIEYAKHLATQAREPVLHYEHKEVGYNYRMSNIVAGVGRAQFEVLEQRVQARRNVFTRYKEALAVDNRIHFQQELVNSKSNRWLTACTIEDTYISYETVIQQLSAENIEARPLWKPMHLQPLFLNAPYFTNGQDVAQSLYTKGICLPSGSNLSIEEQNKVVEVFLKCLL